MTKEEFKRQFREDVAEMKKAAEEGLTDPLLQEGPEKRLFTEILEHIKKFEDAENGGSGNQGG